MAFEEESWIDGRSASEVYVHRDENGWVSNAYADHDSVEILREAPTGWTPGRNPLFLHATDPAALVAWMDRPESSWIGPDEIPQDMRTTL